MNVFYFDQVIEWNLKHWSMTDWTYQIIQDPEELAPNILPDDFKLIIAEKPSVARDIAAVLGIKKKGDGFIAGTLSGNEVVVSWCLGHLVALCDPGRPATCHGKVLMRNHQLRQPSCPGHACGTLTRGCDHR